MLARIKYLVLIVLLIVFFTFALPARAEKFCRNYNGNLICIISIKRSAKNYWEYRASVSINGVVRAIEIYNCRNRFRIQKNGNVVAFEPNGAGEFICSRFKK
ncbi:MAG: hypothetical protein F6K10_07775 [Moorea sp. SIO2B7]|nr:hypothetical protein [Moorena sp. SIO2B7]